MAYSSKKKKSQPPSLGDDSLEATQHTTVATPEIEVSLVDRMKKRFSTRNPAASDVSTADDRLETSAASAATGKRAPQKKTSKRKSLGQKVVQIDKLFSPDRGSSKVFQSPTRFPKNKSGLSASGPSASSESDDTTQAKQSTSKTNGRAKRNRKPEEGGGSSHSSFEGSADDSDHCKESAPQSNEITEVPSVTKKRRSDLDTRQSSSSKGGAKEVSPRGGRGGMSDEETAGPSQEIPSRDTGMSTRKEKRTKKKGSAVMASGEVEAHMADKEFIGNQVRVISTPFVLESGPRSWMQIWKGQQSSAHDVEPPDIPANVIDRIVSKINVHMDDVYQGLLGRQQQRNTLMSLDDLRKDAQEQKQNNLGMGIKAQASLQEIISSYPSEWPGSVEEENEQMTERYAALRARLFALSRSLSVTKQQCEQYKALAGALERVDANLEKCSSEDLQKEVERTGELVSKIQEKLLSRDLTSEGDETGRGRNIDDSDDSHSIRLAPPTNHAALVKILFKAATVTQSP
ncbi:dentin matrix acidic phosphoprotein 1-like [Patiria miniata]|uniref:Uncharacterized protein n=1 Tax=Patiria miniata TaxID=46514 RepID=A0A914B1K4_PATMI|nr:dentin matrix acidic phosphoprotein 1-like [Patiria miniata]